MDYVGHSNLLPPVIFHRAIVVPEVLVQWQLLFRRHTDSRRLLEDFAISKSPRQASVATYETSTLKPIPRRCKKKGYSFSFWPPDQPLVSQVRHTDRVLVLYLPRGFPLGSVVLGL
jgi:hypothetical protein